MATRSGLSPRWRLWKLVIGAALLLAACAPQEHRSEAVPCSPDLPASNAGRDQPAGMDGGCRFDSDCVGIQGRCVAHGDQFVCSFDARCHSNADCGPSSLCRCEGSTSDLRPVCVGFSNCRVDKDCGSGGYCSPSRDMCFGPDVQGYFCHTPKDTCTNDSDCQNKGLCTFDPSERLWSCKDWCY